MFNLFMPKKAEPIKVEVEIKTPEPAPVVEPTTTRRPKRRRVGNQYYYLYTFKHPNGQVIQTMDLLFYCTVEEKDRNLNPFALFNVWMGVTENYKGWSKA